MMLKPRILIAMHYMELGGAESALLGLLQAIDPNQMDVDLFIYDHRGELMQYIPDTVNLLPQNDEFAMLERPVPDLLKRGFWGIAFGRIIAMFLAKLDARNNVEHLDNISVFHFIADCVSPFLPMISSAIEYDLAISFLLPHQYVLKKVNAKVKMAWLHTDYSKVYVSKNELRVWKGYDYIAAISEDVGKAFLSVFPSLSSKITPIENILSSKFVRLRAMDSSVDLSSMRHKSENEIILLTVGRYSYPKKLDEVPMIARKILEILRSKSPSFSITWYIIGYGSVENEIAIRNNIEREEMQTHVILLGKQCNPYPFIKACDVYVQPSRYEGKSITVREAQILKKPVVVTHYPTATSQIMNGIDGIIVPMDVDDCAKAIASFLTDSKKQKQLVDYLSSHDYGNENEVEKIYKMVRV